MFLIVIGTKSLVLLGPCELAASLLSTYQPHSISVSDCPSVDNSSNNGSHVRNRESVVNQKLGRVINGVLPMERKDVEERSDEIDPFSGDVRHSKNGAYIRTELGLSGE
jgi:hypothetical protein